MAQRSYDVRVNSDTPELLAFIAEAQRLSDQRMKQQSLPPDKIYSQAGTRYIRVYKQNSMNGQLSLYCFIDRTNGDILKGSWKAPVKNGVRGNIFTPGWQEKIDWHGPKYLR